MASDQPALDSGSSCIMFGKSTTPATIPASWNPSNGLISSFSSSSSSSSQNGDDDDEQCFIIDPDHDQSLKKFSISSTSTTSSSTISDSGTESQDIDDETDPKICENEKLLLKYFAQDDSKTNRLARRRLSGRLPYNNDKRKSLTNVNDINHDDEDDDDDDESTLSESSCPSTPGEYDINDNTPRPSAVFDFDQICAAIGDKLMERLVPNNDNDNIGLAVTDVIVPEKPLDIPESSDDTNNSNEDNDDEDDGRKKGLLLRSTSLRTGKTPPGTPGGKKIVRFADALGLDLASIRHIVDDGRPYQPPLAAFKALKLDDDDRERLLFQNDFMKKSSSTTTSSPVTVIQSLQPITFTLKMLFSQPSSDPLRFLELVRNNKICLENCMVTGRRRDSGKSGDIYHISCIIRIQNICFHKRVTLRFTTNEWLTWHEIQATYIPNSNDTFSDKFDATLEISTTVNNYDQIINNNNNNNETVMIPGQRLMFALKFEAIHDDRSPQEFWDNNNGMNYSFIYQRC